MSDSTMMRATSHASLLAMMNLAAVMQLANGRLDRVIGLLDGPVMRGHPDLADAIIRELPGARSGACHQVTSAACRHGTFVAGILMARRSSLAPALCPTCTLLVRPIFPETTSDERQWTPSATPVEVATALTECIAAGAHVINLSAGFAQPTMIGQRALEAALDEAARRGVIVVAAAGNQGQIGSSTITRHPWVIPVVAYDARGKPMHYANLGSSIGRRGLGAPGEAVASLGVDGEPRILSGTSVAAPFVTGAIALLWSLFPSATPAAVKLAVTRGAGRRRTSIVPPLLDAHEAYHALLSTHSRRLSDEH